MFTNPSKILICYICTLLLTMTSTLFADYPFQEEGVCARVRIQITQDVAITRSAFRATLEISNSPENVKLENLNVIIDITNSEEETSNQLFAIKDPVLTNINNIEGNGTLEPGASAKAVWTIIPLREAAFDRPVSYKVGGTMSYIESGRAVNVTLFPAPITVKPDPILELNYFLTKVVYSDDPFTDDIEPAEAFPLGLIMTNKGKGTAHNVRISSSQPKIIENEKGLLIDFKIIGAQVNTEQISPSLNVNLGDIAPDQTSVAKWLMTSSLQGEFIEYSAVFEHIDDLGDPRLSIMESVNIHETIHTVRVDFPSDDYKPDFLVNDIEDDYSLPDTLYKSDASTESVNSILDVKVSGEINQNNLEVVLSVSLPEGWVYIKTDDPGKETFPLKKVTRSDGKEILIDDNAWTTHRTRRYIGYPVFREHTLHLFDFISIGDNYQYTLSYEYALVDNSPPQTILNFFNKKQEINGVHYITTETNIFFTILDDSPIETYFKIDDGDQRTDDYFKINDYGIHIIEYYSIDDQGNEETHKIDKIFVMETSEDDIDSDGMPDEWERQNGLNPSINDSSEDFDNDGFSNLQEYIAGSLPNNKKSKPDQPIADAGVDQTVYEGETVRLNSSNSYDFDEEDIVSYQWTKIDGPEINLSDSKAINPHFIAPNVGYNGASILFELSIIDKDTLIAKDYCIVNVIDTLDDNSVPIANAGNDISDDVSEEIILDGSNSYDPDNDILTYKWEQIEGFNITLSNPDSVTTSFIVPEVCPDGAIFIFRLTVTDSFGLRSQDTCMVNIKCGKILPIANAGQNQICNEGATITLEASENDDSIVKYYWRQTSGKPVTLSDPKTAKPTFVTPPVGAEGSNLNFELIVENNEGFKSSDNVNVTINNNEIDIFPDDILSISCSNGKYIGLELNSGGHCTKITSIDPSIISDNSNRPTDLIYGLFDMEYKTDYNGETIIAVIHFPEAVPEDYSWFKYGQNGWFDYKNNIQFSNDRKEVSITLIDGGAGDDDGTENGFISDPSGIGTLSQSTPQPVITSDEGGGGCFINTIKHNININCNLKKLYKYFFK